MPCAVHDVYNLIFDDVSLASQFIDSGIVLRDTEREDNWQRDGTSLVGLKQLKQAISLSFVHFQKS